MRQATALFVIVVAAAPLAADQKYRETDPVPPTAKGKVLPLQAKALEIRGLSSAVTGKAELLAAALRDLGAQRVGTEVHIALSSDILFDFDKAVLRAEATPALAKIVLVIQSYSHPSVAVEGHSDSIGAHDYNQQLSERRAKAVQSWLVSHGVGATITTRGWGASKPVVPNINTDGSDNPANRQKNRRVEIVVKPQ